MRGIVHGKSNLAPPSESLAFGLDPISGFCWLGKYPITLDELLDEKPKKESQFAKARRLLETELAHGEVAAVEIMERAEEQGINTKTLNRAKFALGVISIKRGSQWFWSIPIEFVYKEDRQDSPVGALSIFLAETEAV
ncbi:hypothetical protein AGMMS49975_22980 [Clostridia bacterium]|nr:hypothetical protein AGMMS49975_22980 [Clostridia bacterium]